MLFIVIIVNERKELIYYWSHVFSPRVKSHMNVEVLFTDIYIFFFARGKESGSTWLVKNSMKPFSLNQILTLRSFLSLADLHTREITMVR